MRISHPITQAIIHNNAAQFNKLLTQDNLRGKLTTQQIMRLLKVAIEHKAIDIAIILVVLSNKHSIH